MGERDCHDGQRVLDQNADGRVNRPPSLGRPLLEAVIHRLDGEVGDRDLLVLQRPPDEQRRGQQDATRFQRNNHSSVMIKQRLWHASQMTIGNPSELMAIDRNR